MNTVVPLWVTLIATPLLVIGGLLTLIGSFGLLRFKIFYARLHAPTLGNTLGMGCVLLASILISSSLAQRPVLHEILITVCLLTTSPITTMLLMRATLFRSQDGIFSEN